MLITITISLFVLVVFNFILLKLSCNKIKKQPVSNKKPLVFTPPLTIELDQDVLAPTGS